MKKKFGFTLAEVLITLIVIGVVAAMAAPALSGAFQKSKVGPSLRKTMNVIENANEILLSSRDSDRLSFGISGADNYITQLSTIVKGSVPSDDAKKSLSGYTLKNYDGSQFPKEDDEGNTDINTANIRVYNLQSGESIGILTPEEIEAPAGDAGTARGIFADMYYDINGFDKTPNKLGKDIFVFVIDDNGSVLPKYSNAYSDIYLDEETNDTWKDSEDNKCTEETVSSGLSCAGAIADNAWKVIYKY